MFLKWKTVTKWVQIIFRSSKHAHVRKGCGGSASRLSCLLQHAPQPPPSFAFGVLVLILDKFQRYVM